VTTLVRSGKNLATHTRAANQPSQPYQPYRLMTSVVVAEAYNLKI